MTVQGDDPGLNAAPASALSRLDYPRLRLSVDLSYRRKLTSAAVLIIIWSVCARAAEPGDAVTAAVCLDAKIQFADEMFQQCGTQIRRILQTTFNCLPLTTTI